MQWIETFTAGAIAALTASILPAIILLVIGILAIRIVVKIVTTALNKTKLEKAAHSLILSVARAVLYILLGLMVATKLGIDDFHRGSGFRADPGCFPGAAEHHVQHGWRLYHSHHPALPFR